MPIKLSGSSTTGLANPKGFRTRDSDGAVWSTAGTPAFEAYNAANIANYGITAAETGAVGVYTFTDPAETTPGRFRLIAAAGTSLVVADVRDNTFWEDAAGPVRAPTAAEIFTTQMTESYASPNTVPTMAQALFMTLQRVTQFSISGTTITVQKLDESTQAFTLTTNSATVPTSSTRGA